MLLSSEDFVVMALVAIIFGLVLFGALAWSAYRGPTVSPRRQDSHWDWNLYLANGSTLALFDEYGDTVRRIRMSQSDGGEIVTRLPLRRRFYAVTLTASLACLEVFSKHPADTFAQTEYGHSFSYDPDGLRALDAWYRQMGLPRSVYQTLTEAFRVHIHEGTLL